MIRLQKYLADCGVASRRNSEKLIEEGRVTVNGVTVTTHPIMIDPNKDTVAVDDKMVTEKEGYVYYIFYKPFGVISSMKDDLGRTSLEHYFSKLDRRVFPVGRLDYDSEGLLLMTDDGNLTHQLTHPSYEVPKYYEVTLNKPYQAADAQQLKNGINIGDTRPVYALNVCLQNQDTTHVTIAIEEGRNRQVRRMFDAQGYQVQKLKRIAVGKLQLPNMQPGQYQQISAKIAMQTLEK